MPRSDFLTGAGKRLQRLVFWKKKKNQMPTITVMGPAPSTLSAEEALVMAEAMAYYQLPGASAGNPAETSTAAAQPEEATSPASVMAEDPAEGETEEAAPEAAATVNAAGDGESVKPKGPTVHFAN